MADKKAMEETKEFVAHKKDWSDLMKSVTDPKNV